MPLFKQALQNEQISIYLIGSSVRISKSLGSGLQALSCNIYRLFGTGLFTFPSRAETKVFFFNFKLAVSQIL